MKTRTLLCILSIVLLTTSCVETTSPPDKVAKPVFSKDAGILPPSTTVTISCATSGATIEYWTSLDPTHQTGPNYLVGAACTLYAQAIKSGYEASDVASAAYTIAEYKFDLNFQIGYTTSWNNIYVAWLEDASGSCIQNLYICNRLVNHEVSNMDTKQALPYWKNRVLPALSQAQIDAVSGATLRNTDFSIPTDIAGRDDILYSGTSHTFTVYFEIDRSHDPNGWFADQPALLYSATVDLDIIGTTSTFPLTAIGWSRNAGDNTNQSGYTHPDASATGVLQNDLRYLQYAPVSDVPAFGAAYGDGTDMDATKMTKSISLRVTKL